VDFSRDVFVRVTTPEPWGFLVRTLEDFGDDLCSATLPSCAILPPKAVRGNTTIPERWLQVATPDFETGPANLYIEVVEEGATCP
jgi:hypothetical protein